MKQYLEKRGIYITWSQLVMRIIFDLVGFLLALLPAGLTLYLTDVWITSGTHMPTSWILGIIVCVFLIHFYQFYFVNYNSQMNADRMAGNYRQHLAQKILSSSIPAYESQNKARIQNMANDVSAIYTVSSYLVTVPANLVKVIIIIGLLLFYASPSVALTAIILIPLYMVPSFLNKSELERLVAKEREAGDLWFQEFDVILNGKVSITLNKVENYMQNRYNEALKSFVTLIFFLKVESILLDLCSPSVFKFESFSKYGLAAIKERRVFEIPDSPFETPPIKFVPLAKTPSITFPCITRSTIKSIDTTCSVTLTNPTIPSVFALVAFRI